MLFWHTLIFIGHFIVTALYYHCIVNYRRSWSCCTAFMHCITVYIVFLICLSCLCNCQWLFQ